MRSLVWLKARGTTGFKEEARTVRHITDGSAGSPSVVNTAAPPPTRVPPLADLLVSIDIRAFVSLSARPLELRLQGVLVVHQRHSPWSGECSPEPHLSGSFLKGIVRMSTNLGEQIGDGWVN